MRLRPLAQSTGRNDAQPHVARMLRVVGLCSVWVALLCTGWSPTVAALVGAYGALQGRGIDLGTLQNQLGLSSLSPQRLGPEEYARVVNYARRQHPDVMEEQVRSQPWFVKAMGNPIVMGALGMIASKLLRR